MSLTDYASFAISGIVDVVEGKGNLPMVTADSPHKDFLYVEEGNCLDHYSILLSGCSYSSFVRYHL